MPREPRCVRNRMDTRKGEEGVPKEGTSRSPDAADADSRRNPKGRAVFRRIPGVARARRIGPLMRHHPRALACDEIRPVAATGHLVRGSYVRSHSRSRDVGPWLPGWFRQGNVTAWRHVLLDRLSGLVRRLRGVRSRQERPQSARLVCSGSAGPGGRRRDGVVCAPGRLPGAGACRAPRAPSTAQALHGLVHPRLPGMPVLRAAPF